MEDARPPFALPSSYAVRPAYTALRIAERFGQPPAWILAVERDEPELYAMLCAYERLRGAETLRDLEAAALAGVARA